MSAAEGSKPAPTPGPWDVCGFHIRSPIHGGWVVADFDRVPLPRDERVANMELMAEAGTVHHETGCTPRQLVENAKASEVECREAWAQATTQRERADQLADEVDRLNCVVSTIHETTGWSSQQVNSLIDAIRTASTQGRDARGWQQAMDRSDDIEAERERLRGEVELMTRDRNALLPALQALLCRAEAELADPEDVIECCMAREAIALAEQQRTKAPDPKPLAIDDYSDEEPCSFCYGYGCGGRCAEDGA